jgi:hypothetical protein
MTLGARVPDLSDSELENLHANALRLQGAASVEQRRQAEELLPLLAAELEGRRVSRVAAQAEARLANARSKKESL